MSSRGICGALSEAVARAARERSEQERETQPLAARRSLPTRAGSYPRSTVLKVGAGCGGGFGWLVWCPAVGWVLGRVEAGFGGCWRVVDAGLVGGASGPGLGRQPEGAGSARRALSTVLKALAQGQRAGNRSRVGPERLTMTAGTAMRRVRLVRFVAGGCPASWVLQHPRLWASTAQASQADVTERERPQEAADCGGGHHLERQHPLGCPGPQHVDVIDVGRPGEHRRDQRQHLATWPRGTRLDPRVDQRLETKTDHQRRRHHQPRVDHDPAVIKGRLQPVDSARRCRHRKCLPRCG